jgi:hypothetical protein
MREKKSAYKILVEKLKERDQQEGLVIDLRKVLSCVRLCA